MTNTENMMTKHRHLPTLTVLVAWLIVGCSNANAPAQNDLAATSSVVTSPSDSGTAVPTEVSDFPDGVYRTELPLARVRELGLDDPGNAGTWTLTVQSGGYQLDCLPIADPGIDCGGGGFSGLPTVELGTVWGSSPAMWFVYDMDRLSELTGCVRYSQSETGCGPEGGYHLNWQPEGDTMVFIDFVGLADEAGRSALNNWTAQPWTIIS